MSHDDHKLKVKHPEERAPSWASGYPDGTLVYVNYRTQFTEDTTLL